MEMKSANLSERLLAFVIDVFPFYLGFLVSILTASIYLKFERIPALFIVFWVCLWGVGLILYIARYNSQGRVTLGKRLLGLRVVDDMGNPLGPSEALIRAFGYILSGAFLGLGFLWAVFHRDGKCWHDLIVRSRVVELMDKPFWAKVLLKIGASGAACAAAGLLFWWNVFIPDAFDKKKIEEARTALNALRQLEEVHRQNHGRYSVEIEELAGLLEYPPGFVSGLSQALEPGVEIKTDGSSYYVIQARARDSKKTDVSFRVKGLDMQELVFPEVR